MKNEKGVILPLTMILSFFFLLLFSHQLILYLNEKKFLIETEGINRLESIMQMSVKDIKEELSALEQLEEPVNSTHTYPIGTVKYSLYPMLDNDVKVDMTVHDHDGRVDQARFFYNFEQKKITNWVELR